MSGSRGRFRRPGSADVGIAVGVLVALLGLLAVFTTAVDVSGLIDDQTRILLGVAGVGLGVIAMRHWIGAEPGGYEPPERERWRPVEPPGEDVDELVELSSGGHSREAGQYYRSQVRERLTPIAIDVLVTRRGLSEEDARERLRAGTWTEDPVAARFFRLGTDGGASDDVTGALRRPLGGEHPYVERTRRVVEELARITEVGE